MSQRLLLLLPATAFGVLAGTVPAARDASPALAPSAIQEPAAATCAVWWPAHREEVERCLRECEIERVVDVPIGVTRPKRAFFVAGSPVHSAAWKPLRPQHLHGFWESYKSEIAAYQIDKYLGLDMVPPTVERRGPEEELGSMMLWLEDVHGWDQDNPPQVADRFPWERQIIRMKMLDLLIGNIDRNEGNLLYDDDFHLIMIDHTRAFTAERSLGRIARPGRIDGVVWDKMEALTFDRVKALIGDWVVGDREIRALLERRDRMKKEIDRMVAEKGERFVFIR